MPRMAKRRLESRPALAEVNLVGDSGSDHPLKRPVDRGTADPRILVADEIVQLVRRDVPFLAQKDIEYAIALARPLPASRAKGR